MFINRLNLEQITHFANVLTLPFDEFQSKDWCKYIKNINEDSKRLHLSVSNNTDYTIDFIVYDFEIVVWDTGLLSLEFIQKKFFQFMYQVFGEEYKKAYIANALRIFDENEDGN